MDSLALRHLSLLLKSELNFKSAKTGTVYMRLRWSLLPPIVTRTRSFWSKGTGIKGATAAKCAPSFNYRMQMLLLCDDALLPALRMHQHHHYRSGKDAKEEKIVHPEQEKLMHTRNWISVFFSNFLSSWIMCVFSLSLTLFVSQVQSINDWKKKSWHSHLRVILFLSTGRTHWITRGPESFLPLFPTSVQVGPANGSVTWVVHWSMKFSFSPLPSFASHKQKQQQL